MTARACLAEAQSSAPPDFVAAALHWLEYLGLVGAIGTAVVRVLGRQSPPLAWANPPLWGWISIAAAGIVGLLVLSSRSLLDKLDLAAVIHVASAGLWAGTILALPFVRPPGGWHSIEARTLIGRFGPVAVIAFVVTALTGLLRATEQLRDVSDLWTTSYGEVLAAKLFVVGAMLVVSVMWRRGTPLPRTDAAFTVVVIGATAVLAAFPK
jgi:hypothetical protein